MLLDWSRNRNVGQGSNVAELGWRPVLTQLLPPLRLVLVLADLGCHRQLHGQRLGQGRKHLVDVYFAEMKIAP